LLCGVLPGVVLTSHQIVNYDNKREAHITYLLSKLVQLDQMHSPFCLSNITAPLLIYSKGRGGRMVAAAVPVAANKVVVEPNVSIVIFIIALDMNRCN
jgi:hypothetical protein